LDWIPKRGLQAGVEGMQLLAAIDREIASIKQLTIFLCNTNPRSLYVLIRMASFNKLTCRLRAGYVSAGAKVWRNGKTVLTEKGAWSSW
jgi:hypothetical protein